MARRGGKLRKLVLEQSWDEDAQCLSEHLDGGGSLDASLLALPLRKVVPAEHPRMAATTAAVAERLSAGDGLLYRYLHDKSPDGLPGDEGAFLLCSFWLVDNLALQGHIERAEKLYDSLCAGPARSDCYRSRSTRRRARSWGTSPGVQPHRRHRQRRHPRPSKGR